MSMPTGTTQLTTVIAKLKELYPDINFTLHYETPGLSEGTGRMIASKGNRWASVIFSPASDAHIMHNAKYMVERLRKEQPNDPA